MKRARRKRKDFKKWWKLLWSRIFVTLRPDFCYRVIYPRNKPHIFIYRHFMLERLTSYFRFAVPFPFLSVNFTAACFFMVFCVAVFMRNTSFAVNSLYHILKLLLFLLGFIILTHTKVSVTVLYTAWQIIKLVVELYGNCLWSNISLQFSWI